MLSFLICSRFPLNTLVCAAKWNTQSLLEKLTISNDFLNLLIQTAKDTGALGAKLTGGGRGGCMIALAQTKTKAQEISQALEDAGAAETWIQGLGVHTYV